PAFAGSIVYWVILAWHDSATTDDSDRSGADWNGVWCFVLLPQLDQTKRDHSSSRCWSIDIFDCTPRSHHGPDRNDIYGRDVPVFLARRISDIRRHSFSGGPQSEYSHSS